MKGRNKILLAALGAGLAAAAAALLVSCGGSSDSQALPSVKWSSTTAAIQLPSFVYDPSAPKDAATAYRFALERPDLLSQVPCYCGCGHEAGHKNNLDCFVKSRNGQNVVFYNHGAG